mmetsp:Transcript_9601/g.39467  ORF Transcript_9601/g.39467 Transcript_9601/m.39467 type:complete len:259 (+) Transcript_9601:386-1162(+)
MAIGRGVVLSKTNPSVVLSLLTLMAPPLAHKRSCCSTGLSPASVAAEGPSKPPPCGGSGLPSGANASSWARTPNTASATASRAARTGRSRKASVKISARQPLGAPVSSNNMRRSESRWYAPSKPPMVSVQRKTRWMRPCLAKSKGSTPSSVTSSLPTSSTREQPTGATKPLLLASVALGPQAESVFKSSVARAAYLPSAAASAASAAGTEGGGCKTSGASPSAFVPGGSSAAIAADAASANNLSLMVAAGGWLGRCLR